MSPEQTPNESPTSTKGIDHSGKLGFEKPYREYKETPLADAPLDVEPGDVHHTGHLPLELQLKEDKKRSPLIYLGTAAAGIALSAGAWIGFGGGNENTAPKNETTTSAPVSSGESHGPTSPEAEQSGPQQIFLSAEQVNILESGDEVATQKVLDETLILQIQNAYNELSKDIENMGSVDLSSISDDPNVQAYIQHSVKYFSPANDGSEAVSLCWTTDNTSGVDGSCIPGLQSVISNGLDGKQTRLASIKLTMDDSSGLERVNRYVFASDDIHYAIDKTNNNRLYLTK